MGPILNFQGYIPTKTNLSFPPPPPPGPICEPHKMLVFWPHILCCVHVRARSPTATLFWQASLGKEVVQFQSTYQFSYLCLFSDHDVISYCILHMWEKIMWCVMWYDNDKNNDIYLNYFHITKANTLPPHTHTKFETTTTIILNKENNMWCDVIRYVMITYMLTSNILIQMV